MIAIHPIMKIVQKKSKKKKKGKAKKKKKWEIREQNKQCDKEVEFDASGMR